MRLQDRCTTTQHVNVMTPPPAATHAAERIQFAPSRAAGTQFGAGLVRLLDQRSWSRVRLLTDAVVLYIATGVALVAAPMPNTTGNRLLAACFPLIALAVMALRPGPDARMYGSVVDTVAHVLGMVSIAAMLTIGLETSLGAGPHPIDVALRLWLFSLVYVAGARVALISIRRQAIDTMSLATPTLVVGAGVVGEHLVKRLQSESRYGLRPVGFIDANPLPHADGARGRSLPVFGGLDDLADSIAAS